jgi:hypothetical protein
MIEVRSNSGLVPKWEYVAPELTYLSPDGGLSQWSDLEPVAITLENISGSGDTFPLQAYFAYCESELYIGLLLPKREGTVSGVELIFIGNNGVFDGIIVDSDLMEGRDVAYVNNSHVAFDSDLGGREGVDVTISDEGDNEFYMIVEETNFPEGDLDTDWEFDEGDSVAVVLQAWVDKDKNMTNRPNFSTVVFDFNFLRLSIKVDIPDKEVDLHNAINPGKYSETKFSSYYGDELEIILDGKKDEDFWKHATTFEISSCLINQKSASSLYNTEEPSSRSVNCTLANDKDNLYLFLEMEKESADSSLYDLLLVLGNNKNCLYNLSSHLFVCKINPSEGSYIYLGLTADFIFPGIISDGTSIVSTVSTWSIQGLTYDSFNIFGDHGIMGAELKLPLFEINENSEGTQEIDFTGGEVVIVDMTYEIIENEPIDPYDNPWSVMIREGDQLKFVIHEIEVNDETFETTDFETTETPFDLEIVIITIFSILPLEVILLRKRRKNQVKNLQLSDNFS